MQNIKYSSGHLQGKSVYLDISIINKVIFTNMYFIISFFFLSNLYSKFMDSQEFL